MLFIMVKTFSALNCFLLFRTLENFVFLYMLTNRIRNLHLQLLNSIQNCYLLHITEYCLKQLLTTSWLPITKLIPDSQIIQKMITDLIAE